jgi:hypothetical protein
MSLTQKVATIVAQREQQQAANEFGNMVKFTLAHRGKLSEALLAAKKGRLEQVRGLSQRTVGILAAGESAFAISRSSLQKAAQSAGSLLGSALQDAGVIESGFVASLAAAGAFDAILQAGAFVPIPLQSGTVGAINTGATAYSVSEGSLKPISKLSLTGAQQNPQKVHCALVITAELAMNGSSVAGQLVQRELRNAVALQSDMLAFANLTSGISTITSSGSTAEAVRADLSALLSSVTLGAVSRPYLITTSLICKRWSMLKDQKGVSAFPDLGPMGGSINGIPVLVSDGISAGLVVLVDAASCAAASGELILSEVEEALLQMDSAPDSPPTASTSMQSLWQMNLSAIRLERYLICVRLRDTAVAVVSNANSYGSGNSPP